MIKPMWCSITKTATPRSRIRKMISDNSARSLATIPAAGSSSSKTRGSVASAVAIINNRCCADEIAAAARKAGG